MKKNKKNLWADHYTSKARKEKYPARSVYKLKEIQSKFKLLRPGDSVLDLGCAPGSWTLFVSEIVGKSGFITGIDLKKVNIKINVPHNVVTDDIFLIKDWNELSGAPFDVVLSDMAPNTTGRKDVDALRSFRLCEIAMAMAQKYLKFGGHFVCKIFQGEDTQDMINTVKDYFTTCRLFRPNTTRKSSKELYIVGMNRVKECSKK
jgi:23S rRNA (uridine2552-2'-O)-methyltransferase